MRIRRKRKRKIWGGRRKGKMKGRGGERDDVRM